MSLQLINRIISQTKKYYPNSKIGYAFTEPLIYPTLSMLHTGSAWTKFRSWRQMFHRVLSIVPIIGRVTGLQK